MAALYGTQLTKKVTLGVDILSRFEDEVCCLFIIKVLSSQCIPPEINHHPTGILYTLDGEVLRILSNDN